MWETISSYSFYQIAILCISAILIGINKTAIPGISILPVVLLAGSFDSRLSTGMQLLMLAWADVIAVIYYRRCGNWNFVLRLLPWALIGLGLGCVILRYIPLENDRAMKIMIGGIVLFLLMLNFIQKKLNPEKIPTGLIPSIFYGSLFGITTMLANAAGPVSAIYLLSMKLPKEEYIGSAAWLLLIVNWLKLPLFCWQGRITAQVLMTDVWMIPLLLFGGFLGVKLLKSMPQKVFENVVTVLVALISIKLLLGF